MPPTPTPALTSTPGAAPVLLVGPHVPLPASAAHPYLTDDPHILAQLDAHITLWHDVGSGVAVEVAGRVLDAPVRTPPLPRGLVDLNRGWSGRPGEENTLFGKGALDAFAAPHLRPGARDTLKTWYHAAMEQLRLDSEGTRGFVEVHSFGDLGSTFHKRAGGRPVRRPQAAVIPTTPWATPFPVGLARLIPGDLRGTSWSLQRRVGDALARHGLQVGPSPYPETGPWALSTRFLAARWFQWLGATNRLPQTTVAHLVHLAWHDEQDAQLDAVATGETKEPPFLLGTRHLAEQIGAWSTDGPALGDAFLAEDDSFTLVIELRNDQVARAPAFGQAIAEALAEHLAAER